MELQRWYNAGQPQTLQLAQILLYANAAVELLGLVLSGGFLPVGLTSLWVLLLTTIWIVILAGQVFGAFGIANSRKVGYRIALTVAFLPVAVQLFIFVRFHVVALGIFSLLFEVVLIAALVHPQSREYQRIWFK